MAFRSPLVASSLGSFWALALRLRSCSAQDICVLNGGAVYNSACYVFADPSVSCTDKCVAEGASCDEGALELTHPECEGALAALGVDIASTTSSWYYNFGSEGFELSSSRWSSSIFDENRVLLGSFRTSGCVVSPTYDATDQASFTTADALLILNGIADAAEAHNFLQETPTCGGASSVYRRVCACLFITEPTTPSPTTPSPTTAAPTTAAPTTAAPTTAAPTTAAPTTPAPTTSAPTTPAPATPFPTTPHPTAGQTPSTIGAGYWRTGEASADVRPCPIPDLCEGGFGGGDDLCVGSNMGAYCQVCPSSYFSSVNGVCVECGSVRGATAAQALGLVLATLLLFGAATFVRPVSRQAPEKDEEPDTLRKGSKSLLDVQATQQATIDELWNKVVGLGVLVTDLQHDLPDKSLGGRLESLLVTTEMFAAKLTRLLTKTPESPHGWSTQAKGLLIVTETFTARLTRRLPKALLQKAQISESGKKMEQVFFQQAHMLCPAIDELASALAGLSAVVPEEEAAVVAQIKSSLATARALDPSSYLRDPPANDAGNAAKVVVSFAQLVAATPFVLVVRRPNNLRSFLGGLNTINLSGPKVLSMPCVFHGNFHGELAFKTIGPLAVATVIGGLRIVSRSSLITASRPWRLITTSRPWRNQSMRCTEYLVALAYVMLTPAINAALRTFPCETFDDGRTLLRADYSIDCDLREHTSYRALAIFMAIVYPIGSLAAFSAVLWKHRDLLHPRQVRRRSKEDNAIAEETKQANAFDLRRFGLLRQIRGRSKEDNAIAQEAKQVNAFDLRRFGLLHDAYEPRAWWFELFETCRRIVLASLVYFATRPSMQLWIAMVLTTLSLATNVVFSPFVESIDGHLYTGAQCVGLALSALALVADRDDKNGGDGPSKIIGGFMVALVTGYILAALVAILMKGQDGMQLDFAPCVTKNEERLAYMEEGDPPEASATDEQESISFSTVDEIDSRHTTSESSTADHYGEGLTSYSQTQTTHDARPIGWSRRANKNTASAQPLGGTASRRSTVAPTDEELSLSDEEGSL